MKKAREGGSWQENFPDKLNSTVLYPEIRERSCMEEKYKSLFCKIWKVRVAEAHGISEDDNESELRQKVKEAAA